MQRAEPKHREQVEVIPATQAVEALIQEYGRLIFHLIYSMVGNWEESEDLTQEVFLRALQAIDAARAESGAHFQAKAWLVRIAINTVRMQLRRQRVVRFVPFSQLEHKQSEGQDTPDVSESVSRAAAPTQPPGYGTPEVADPAEVTAERDAVARTLAKLPESLRLPLLLSIVAGLSVSEIGRVLDLGEVAVRQRLSRARRMFQTLYAYESGEQVINQEVEPRQVQRASSASGRISAHSLQGTSIEAGS
jgi:RNA polymerase sigma-70 factor (ECF subfamily)